MKTVEGEDKGANESEGGFFKDGKGEEIEGENRESAKDGAGETPGEGMIAEEFNGGGLDEFGERGVEPVIGGVRFGRLMPPLIASWVVLRIGFDGNHMINFIKDISSRGG